MLYAIPYGTPWKPVQTTTYEFASKGTNMSSVMARN